MWRAGRDVIRHFAQNNSEQLQLFSPHHQQTEKSDDAKDVRQSAERMVASQAVDSRLLSALERSRHNQSFESVVILQTYCTFPQHFPHITLEISSRARHWIHIQGNQFFSALNFYGFFTFLCLPRKTTAKAPCPMSSLGLYSKSPTISMVVCSCLDHIRDFFDFFQDIFSFVIFDSLAKHQISFPHRFELDFDAFDRETQLITALGLMMRVLN